MGRVEGRKKVRGREGAGDEGEVERVSIGQGGEGRSERGLEGVELKAEGRRKRVKTR
jgi:hypothetical protein